MVSSEQPSIVVGQRESMMSTIAQTETQCTYAVSCVTTKNKNERHHCGRHKLWVTTSNSGVACQHQRLEDRLQTITVATDGKPLASWLSPMTTSSHRFKKAGSVIACHQFLLWNFHRRCIVWEIHYSVFSPECVYALPCMQEWPNGGIPWIRRYTLDQFQLAYV